MLVVRRGSSAATSKYEPNIMSDTFLSSCTASLEKKTSINRDADYQQYSLKDLSGLHTMMQMLKLQHLDGNQERSQLVD